MSRLEIDSLVRVKDSYYKTGLEGLIGKVVAYTQNNIVVQFHGLEGHPELHDGSWYSDRKLDGKCDKRFISPKHLELVEKENKQMTKQDLKSGMTVKLRNGNVYLVVNEALSREEGFEPFIKYKDDLTHIGSKYYDVVEVYLFSIETCSNAAPLKTLLDLTNPNMQLLWKRQELPKLSSAERVILENLDKQYKWIARDGNGSLYVFFKKPTKSSVYWSAFDLGLINLDFPKLFKFVKWEDEQPYSIKELLKGE